MLPDSKSAPADRNVAAPAGTFVDDRVVSSPVAPLVAAPVVAHVGVGVDIDVVVVVVVVVVDAAVDADIDVVAHAGMDADIDVAASDEDPTQDGQFAAGYAACQRMCLDFGHDLAGSAVVGTAALVAGPVADVGRLDTVVVADDADDVVVLVAGKLADVVDVGDAKAPAVDAAVARSVNVPAAGAVVAAVGLAGSMAAVRIADPAAVPEGTNQGRDPGSLPFLVPGT
ncbi:hypothetical protein QNH46_06135 [Paenibacillus woosongensis]|uniref:Uncharacterized protein n=1 Tax=Paenibacillus woosongensis TaxID=307580 RepID=A0AA95I6E2_9BACL|nr:hypothetical protein [Paenibacillus woosongensis]WHX50241.1 hypothetical protein QNH46_06135 [Paenibacillus woosongensis]